MLDHIETLAELSVARGSGFAMLAILTTMIGLSPDPPLMLKVGGILSLLTCLTLILKGVMAERISYRSTELWIMLKPDERPHAEVAQQVLGGILRRVYLRFALYFASGAGVMFLAVIGLVVQTSLAR